MLGVAAFFFKEQLFAVILAPKEANFATYRLLNEASGLITDARSMDFSSVGCLLSWIFFVNFMCRYHKHAVVIILIVAAVVTLTSGVFRSR